MFLEAIMWWGAISLIVAVIGIIFQLNEVLKDIDPDDKFLKKVLGKRFYNFLNKVL